MCVVAMRRGLLFEKISKIIYIVHRETQRYQRCTEKLISVVLNVTLWFTVTKYYKNALNVSNFAIAAVNIKISLVMIVSGIKGLIL